MTDPGRTACGQVAASAAYSVSNLDCSKDSVQTGMVIPDSEMYNESTEL